MALSSAAVDSARFQSDTHRHAVEVNDVNFSYDGKKALTGLGFAIERGEIFGLLGPNGSGKTTLFKLLSTLMPSQDGEIRIFDQDLRSSTTASRRRVGVVFQHPSVDGKLTVGENLAHHGHLYGMRGRELTERKAAMLTRLGLESQANDLVETLSGGMQRRVELAKALLHRPELLILDEPSTGVDPLARREFFSYLAQLREQQGVTIVLTTHYLEEAERCDRLGLLNHGRLAALDTPANLKARVGGDVVVINARDAEALQKKIIERMRVEAMLVDGLIRVERPRGHDFVRDVVEAFGIEIESVTFGKPTLEDVFVHLTGERFAVGSATEIG
jgi:ABC-2 type transport system ATP-binding protein